MQPPKFPVLLHVARLLNCCLDKHKFAFMMLCWMCFLPQACNCSAIRKKSSIGIVLSQSILMHFLLGLTAPFTSKNILWFSTHFSADIPLLCIYITSPPHFCFFIFFPQQFHFMPESYTLLYA